MKDLVQEWRGPAFSGVSRANAFFLVLFYYEL